MKFLLIADRSIDARRSDRRLDHDRATLAKTVGVPEEVMRHGNGSVTAHGRWDFLRIPDMRDFTAAHSDGRGFVLFNNRH